MYKIINFATGELIEEIESPRWLRQQIGVDMPVGCDECTAETADGVMLSDNDTMLGIEGRNMQNYTPTVIVQEIPETVVKIDFMSGAMNDMIAQVKTIETKVNTLYDAQTEGTVLKSDLNAAYKEGVNSYAE